LEEVEAESCEPILMGNHNFFDISLEELFQYGFKSFAIVINSASNVCDECVVWEF
jgi:hypothetical protein